MKILKLAKDFGITFFDTAPLYSKGYSELLLGRAFRNVNEIKIMNKIGKYSVPNTFLPPELALPLNFLKKKIWQKNIKNYSNTKEFTYLDSNYDYESLFKRQICNSKKKLREINIEGILFHEINPYTIDLELVKNIKLYLKLLNINKIGYAGMMPRQLLEKPLPEWIEIVQIEVPIDLNEIDKTRFFSLVEKYSDKEFRFFNIFKNKKCIKERMIEAKKILKRFNNTKIIFQTTCPDRLERNLDFFLK